METSKRRQTVPTVHSSSRDEEALEHDPKGARHHPSLHRQILASSDAGFSLPDRKSAASVNPWGSNPSCWHRRRAGRSGHKLQPGGAWQVSLVDLFGHGNLNSSRSTENQTDLICTVP